MSGGLTRPARWIIRAAARLVPAARRAEWREEWEAELAELEWRTRQAAPQNAGWSSVRFAGGSMVHAIWELKQALMFDLFCYDVKHAARALRRAPAFTIVAVITLALGVGANAAVFSMTNRLLLRAPDGIGEPAGLVQVGRNLEPDRFDNWPLPVVEAMNTELGGVFEGVAGYAAAGAIIGHGMDAEPVAAQLVTANYFDVLQVRPVLGRGFAAEAGAPPGSAPVAVISHALWQRHFAAARDVLEREIIVNGASLRVVGVAPAGFHGADVFRSPADVFIPMSMQRAVRNSPDEILRSADNSWVWALGRLRPGVGGEAAVAGTRALLDRIAAREPALSGVKAQIVAGVGARPAERRAVGIVSGVLVGLVVLVLLIACANLGGLAVARGSARSGEVGVRMALGAGRGRVLWQIMLENLLVGGLGAIVAMGIAVVVAPQLPSFLPVPVSVGFAPDARVLGLTLLTGLLAGAVFGVLPALAVTRRDPATALSGGSESRGATARPARTRAVLVVGQLALCFAVIAAASLLVRSARNVYTAQPGFDPSGVAVVTLAPGRVGMDRAVSWPLMQDVVARLSALPGVDAAALAASVPIVDAQSNRTSLAPSDPVPAAGMPAPAPVYTNRIHGDYFAAMRIPILSGRTFLPGDAVSGGAVVIDRRFAT